MLSKNYLSFFHFVNRGTCALQWVCSPGCHVYKKQILRLVGQVSIHGMAEKKGKDMDDVPRSMDLLD